MQATIEYMILIPVLILQIFLFPILVNAAMGQWTTDRQTLELQEAASSLSSIIEQTYISLNHTSILTCTFTTDLSFQPTIEGYNFTGSATLETVSSDTFGASKVLSVTLNLVGKNVSANTEVTLGQNVNWANTQFTSNPPTTSLIAQKFANQTIQLSFGS